MIIYKITNILNNKCYIGQTIKNLNHRINRHFYNASIKINHPLYDSINKYGKESFLIEVLETCDSLDNLNLREIHYISLYKSTDRNFGYNLTSGGKNCPMSEDTKQKIKEFQLNRVRTSDDKFLNSKRFTGKKMTEKMREVLNKLNANKKLTPEHIEILRQSNLGRKASDLQRSTVANANRTRIHSDETRKKLSAGRKGKKHSEETKAKIRETKRLKKLQVINGI